MEKKRMAFALGAQGGAAVDTALRLARGRRTMAIRRVLLVVVGAALSLQGDALAGLIGHWALDDGAGVVAKDSSGGGHDGQLVDGPVWAQGMIGGALELDGVKARIEIPYWPAVTPAKGATMACWAFPKDTGRACLIGQFESYGMALMTDLQLKSVIWGGDWVLSNVTIPQNEWSHIVMTFDVAGKQRKVYLDGGLVGERSDSVVVPKVQNNLGIGLWIGWPDSWGDDSFTGIIDDVQLYDLILTGGQVAGLAAGEIPSFTKAFAPNPADGALDVTSALLQWTKGETATLHDVYLGADPNLTEADLVMSRRTSVFYYHVAGLVPGTRYYWRVDEIDKDGVTVYPGDVWTFVARDVKAYHPVPADGSCDVLPAPTLTWMPGIGATKHRVYFGDDPNAVAAGAAETDQGESAAADTAFAPGTLESLATYFWRVDETVLGGIKAGPVWSFTTCLPIEDFESYTDEEGSRIYETWIDGLTTKENGSTVGYLEAPFAEQTIVYDANQSMPLDYNNVDSPFYSEAERDFDGAQDWTVDGAGALVLHVRGRLTNKPEPLYVMIEDQSQNSGIVFYPDPSVGTAAQWVTWQIPFSEFSDAGVKMTRVRKLYIGVGDRANPTAGGKGLIYIDAIRLVKP